ncbi:hypothetical protein [Paraburkholderia xenovorans]
MHNSKSRTAMARHTRLPEDCTREAPPREDRLALDITERFLRDFIKVHQPRLVRSGTQALLVEEMEVCPVEPVSILRS